MRVKLEGIRGYDYEKDGKRKIGKMLEVRGTELKAEDDGHGNFCFGYLVQEIFLPNTLVSKLSASDLQQFLGREIELSYVKELGDRYERLVDIDIPEGCES